MVAVILALSLTGCPTAKPATPPRPQPTQTGVVGGTFCSDAGQPGITERGVKMICTTTPADPQLRWRKA